MSKHRLIHHHFIYKLHPERYPQQTNFTKCGLFTIKAVIESYHPDIRHKSRYYATGLSERMLGFSMPRQLASTMKKYGLKTKNGKLREKNEKKQIEFLKKQLTYGPVIVLVSHAYTKRYKFNIIRAILAQHYLSLRGYDDKKEVFYCYDAHTDIREKGLPVGNIEMNYRDLLRYRNRAGIGLFRKRYITILGKEK